MSEYAELDAAIIDVIENYDSPSFGQILSLLEVEVSKATTKGRRPFRVLDGRLQALRKKGLITFSNGWHSALGQ